MGSKPSKAFHRPHTHDLHANSRASHQVVASTPSTAQPETLNQQRTQQASTAITSALPPDDISFGRMASQPLNGHAGPDHLLAPDNDASSHVEVAMDIARPSQPAREPLLTSDTRPQAPIDPSPQPVPASIQSSPQIITLPPKPVITCIICVEKFAPEQEHSAFLRPCRICHSIYCTNCVRDMFIKACKVPSRMPPRCCNMIQLHVAAPYLDKAEIKLYRDKFEEWSTPRPTYCPVPTCSAFIPDRLIPSAKFRHTTKQRVDSMLGAPALPSVSCPVCASQICSNCRQLAHPDDPCKDSDFGVDETTAKILKSWGYKRCPKCRNGVRRMLGCNHMQCLCGAQWCWVCQKPMDECAENCYDEEDENEITDLDEPEGVTSTTEAIDMETDNNRPTTASIAPLYRSDITPNPPISTSQTPPPPRLRNLDANTPQYWESLGMNFGTEPAEDPPDRTWQCEHEFEIAKVGFEDSIKGVSTATGMECSRCWSPVHPEIILPRKVGAGTARIVPQVTRAGLRGRDGTMRQGGRLLHRGFGARRGNRPGREEHLGDPVLWEAPLSRSASFSTPYELNQPSGVADPTLLSSSAPGAPDAGMSKPLLPSNVVTGSEFPFSFAHECKYCGIMVCSPCKQTLLLEDEQG